MSDVTLKKATGVLSASIYLEYPNCDECLDLFDVDYANDEGQLWDLISAKIPSSQAIPWENIGNELKCPKCKEYFIFDELEY